MCHSRDDDMTVYDPPILATAVEYDVPVNQLIDCDGLSSANSDYMLLLNICRILHPSCTKIYHLIHDNIQWLHPNYLHLGRKNQFMFGKFPCIEPTGLSIYAYDG